MRRAVYCGEAHEAGKFPVVHSRRVRLGIGCDCAGIGDGGGATAGARIAAAAAEGGGATGGEGEERRGEEETKGSVSVHVRDLSAGLIPRAGGIDHGIVGPPSIAAATSVLSRQLRKMRSRAI